MDTAMDQCLDACIDAHVVTITSNAAASACVQECRAKHEQKGGRKRLIDAHREDEELVVDGSLARIGEHEFDAFNMEWNCACGETMEVDAETCGSCGAANPFFGILI
jgi:hypothetical protein